MRPGDRKKRWRSTCQLEGCIMLSIAAMLICAGGIAGILLGLIVGFFAILDFRDAGRGWRMSDKRPPWADEHDAIDAKRDKARKTSITVGGKAVK